MNIALYPTEAEDFDNYCEYEECVLEDINNIDRELILADILGEEEYSDNDKRLLYMILRFINGGEFEQD